MNEVRILPVEERVLHGLWTRSNDKTIAKDIATLSAQYHAAVGLAAGRVLPYVVLSQNYDTASGDFELFVGSTTPSEGLETLVLLAGDYAVMTVKPKLGFLWGAAIGSAKRFFYTKWLPQSQYAAKNVEYEYHTEKSVGKHPTIDLIFAIEKPIPKTK